MKEDRKKISLLTNLSNIIDNHYVSPKVFNYKFYSMRTLILNHVGFDTHNKFVDITLYLDELVVVIYDDDKYCNTYTLPYNFVDEIYILLEDENEK